MLTFAIQYRGVEQLVARRAHNPEAGGSSPSPATKQDISNEMSLFFIVMIPQILSLDFTENVGYN